ncbi:MAG: response regulator [Chloroflexi bacterium]|nr:response regulator [Chloroflexota bacterium]
MNNQKRGNILVVDCDELTRNTLTRTLLSDGYNCVTAPDGETALWKISEQEFALILTDVNIPDLSYVEMLPRLIAAHPDTVIIVITTLDDIETALEAIKLGAYDFILKPLNVDEISMRVGKALERRRLMLENREYQSRMEQQIELQVADIRKYLYEAVEVLGLEQMALDKPEAVREAKRYAKMMFQLGGTKGTLDLEESYLQMARTLALIAESHEPYARGHSDRVGLLAYEIAIQLGCSTEMKRQIKFAAMLQDIGKIAVPDRILSKQDNLTQEEYAEINRHPTASVEIIQHVDYFKDIIPLVESHHEWYDGSGGYPGKLKGNRIPLGARILAVADAYDAMTCPRPHRRPLTPGEAAQALKKGAGKQWDPVIVDALLKKLGVTARDSA